MPAAVYLFYLTLVLVGVRTSFGGPLPLPSATEAEDSDWEDTSPEEGPFFEGDIVTGSETIPIVEFKPSNRNLVANPRLLWPQKTLYYEFSPGQFHGELRTLVEEALADIMNHSCVRFSPRGQQTTYLKLKRTGKGCNSKVGYQKEEGPLTLQIAGRKCYTLGTVQHEFLHALGLWHEHTRADRDDYVTVVWENVQPDRKSNFVKRNDQESEELLKLPYDYGSIMHYKKSSFSKHGGSSTLVPTHKEAVKVMGQRLGLTKGDIAKLNRLYKCTGGYYTGEDLEEKPFLLGQYYRAGNNRGGHEEEDVFGGKTRNNEKSSGVTLGSENEQILAGFDGIDKRGRTKSEIKDEALEDKNEQLEDVKKTKTFLYNENTEELKSLINTDAGKQNFEISAGKTVNQRRMSESKYKESSGNFAPYFEINHSSAWMDKAKLEVKIEEYEYDHRSKRETTDIKSQRDREIENTKQKSNENNESFAPQKILPELLKGVLNSENDRPIVIQFAIYQPIVYKSSNQSEQSNENNQDEGKSDEERSKESRGSTTGRREYDSRNGEPKGDNTDNRQDQKKGKSSQKVKDFTEYRDKPEENDRTDRGFVPHDQKEELNRKPDHEYEPSTRRTKLREENYPEHQTEYVPVSENHDITISKKEYNVSPHTSHLNGKELRVSQTDYKIESKSSRNHNTDFSLSADHLPQSEVHVKPPVKQGFKSSQMENPEEPYSHEGIEYEYTRQSPEKVYNQPHESSHRETGYDTFSLVNQSQGKGAKSTFERTNNNNFHHTIDDRISSHNEESGLSVHPHSAPLELKQAQQAIHSHPHDYQQRNYKASNRKEESDDIAPDFHESADYEVLVPTSQNPTNSHSELKEDDFHEIVEYHTPTTSEIKVDTDNHKINNNAKESIVYDKFSYRDTGSHSIISDHAEEEILDKETVKDRKDDSAPNPHKSFDSSRGNNYRENEPRTRNEEAPSFNTKSLEEFSGSIAKSLLGDGKTKSRPDIVTREDISSELDISERRKKLERMDRKTEDISETGDSKRQEPATPNGPGHIKNKNRVQSNTRSTVVRKKIPNNRMQPEEQEDLVNEEDLISKPQISKLNLNPRQALPLKASVHMERKSL